MSLIRRYRYYTVKPVYFDKNRISLGHAIYAMSEKQAIRKYKEKYGTKDIKCYKILK